MTIMRLLSFLGLLSLYTGCVPIPGDEGQACNSQGLCGPGLVCNQDNRCISHVSNLCVDIDEGICHNPDASVPGFDCGWYVMPNDSNPLALMCKIAAGTYPIGQTPNDTVIDEFYLDRFEVTNKRYNSFLTSRPGGSAGFVPTCDPDPIGKSWTDNPPAYPSSEDAHPVVCLTRAQAEEFCDWAGKRLPVSIEWEAAARGIGLGPYPWGDAEPLQQANCNNDVCEDVYDPGTCEQSSTICETTAPVETLENDVGSFGHRHMAGNVSEWIESASGLIRGGSWDDGALDGQDRIYTELEIWWTKDWDAASETATIGFRCAY